MKILLLGEYSGVHTDLANELKRKGHEVITAHAGDDFKNYPRDFELRPLGNNFFLRRLDMIRRYSELRKIIRKGGFDIIQIINTGIFPRGIDKLIYKEIYKTNSKIFFLGAGEDNIVWDAYNNGAFRYYAFDGMLKLDGRKMEQKWNSSGMRKLSINVLTKANAIIPLCVEYKIAYERVFKKTPFIPLSINTSIVNIDIEGKEYKKVRILHGVNSGREGYKGTNFILPALDLIEKEFGDKVEIIRSTNLPFEEYLKLLFYANIVIDQALCYSVSMNALYSMLNGCVVLGGCEKEYLDSLAINTAPIVNILPDTLDIYNKVKLLIETPQLIKDIGTEASKFVRCYHSVETNTDKFIEVWNKY